MQNTYSIFAHTHLHGLFPSHSILGTYVSQDQCLLVHLFSLPVTLLAAIRQVRRSARDSGVTFKDYGEWGTTPC